MQTHPREIASILAASFTNGRATPATAALLQKLPANWNTYVQALQRRGGTADADDFLNAQARRHEAEGGAAWRGFVSAGVHN